MTAVYSRQIVWLQYLQTLDPRAIQTAYNRLIEGAYRPSDWQPLGVHKKIDYRTVLRNEVVFDLDFQKWDLTKKYADKIMENLHILGAPFLLALSGGKGIHISLFFSAKGFDPEKMELARKLGLQYKDLRLWLWHHVLDQAGVDRAQRGPGKPFDSACVGWSDLASGHLLRTIGGQKPIKGDDGSWSFRFKHMLAELPAKRAHWPEEEELEFPKAVELYEIPPNLLNNFLDKYATEKVERPSQEPIVNYPGKHLQLSCIQRLRQGMPAGQRNLGCQLLAIACACDGLDEKAALDIAHDYSARTASPMAETEMREWVHWALEKSTNPYWHCGQPKGLGLCTEKQEADCKLQEAQHEGELALLKSPELMKQIEEHLDRLIVGEKEAKLTLFFDCASLWLPPSDYVHSLLSGESSAGKTHVALNTLKLFPPEMILDFTRITGAAMDYADIDFHKKILFIGEGAGANAAIESIKMHTDNISGGTKVLCTIKDEETGRMTTEMRESKGTPIIVTTSAKIIADQEFTNRLMTIGVDTSTEQTSRILDRQAEMARWWGADKKALMDGVVGIQKALSLLKEVEVVIPYGDEIKKMFDPRNTRSRRDYRKFMDMIKASAAIHQFQRDTVMDGAGHIAVVATEQDAEIVYRVGWQNVAMTAAGLEQASALLLQAIQSKRGDLYSNSPSGFTVQDLRKSGITNLGPRRIRDLMENLINLSYFDYDGGGKGHPITYFFPDQDADNRLKTKAMKGIAFPDLNTLRELVENFKKEPKRRKEAAGDAVKGFPGHFSGLVEARSPVGFPSSPICLAPPLNSMETVKDEISKELPLIASEEAPIEGHILYRQLSESLNKKFGLTQPSVVQRTRLIAVYDLVKSLEREYGTAKKAEVLEQAGKNGIPEPEAEKAIEKLKLDGYLFEPKYEVYKST